MSIIDTAGHSVVSFTGKEKAFTGQRLAKFSWKTNAVGIKRESVCVSLPVIGAETVADNLVVLTPIIVEYLHSVQDKMIRGMLEGASNPSTVTTESISVAAIIEYLEASDEGGRLTKESVGNWFNENISEMLAVTLADRLGVSEVPTAEESDRVMRTVEAFKGKISALAGGKTVYEPKICKSLISALELADAGDALATRFKGRLAKMIAEHVAGDDLLSAL